jgi:hypothetical protein
MYGPNNIMLLYAGLYNPSGAGRPHDARGIDLARSTSFNQVYSKELFAYTLRDRGEQIKTAKIWDAPDTRNLKPET